MKPRKVVIIGLDALDSDLLSKFEDDLPNLGRLKKRSPHIEMKSVFPPDTPTAWATIYTGLNPAEHGIIHFQDPLERVSTIATKEIDNTPIKGRTFWDHAGKHGKKVCVLYPQLGYPVWPVNGILIGRSTSRYSDIEPVQAYPPSLSRKYDLSPLANIRAVPDPKLLPNYISRYKGLIAKEAELGLHLYHEEVWDLFFMYSSALDWIGHNLWMYFDEEDPSYPGPNPFQQVFGEFYRFYDQVVGKFMENISSDTKLIVMSDHGFGGRPFKLVNVNEVLRRNGFLVAKEQGERKGPYGLLEAAKAKLIEYVNKYGVGEIPSRVVHTVPALRKLFTSPFLIDWKRTQAYVLDLSGIKAYTYGGIMINENAVRMEDYETTRDSIIGILSDLREPETGKTLFEWIRRREEMYAGSHIKNYPDIIFNLKNGYGAGWAVQEAVIGASSTHNIQSGSHKIDTPVFLTPDVDQKELTRSNIALEDVAPTILSLLGIEEDFGFDGKSLFGDV